MKSFVSLVILLAVFVAASFGAESRGIFNDPKHPGKCTITDSLILSPGDIVKDPNDVCARILCGEKGYAVFQTCGVQVHHGCTLGDYIDPSLPYPECCARHLMCD